MNKLYINNNRLSILKNIIINKCNAECNICSHYCICSSIFETNTNRTILLYMYSNKDSYKYYRLHNYI